MKTNTIKVEVAYSAASGAQAIITVNLPRDSTVADAIIASKILEFTCFPEFAELKSEELEVSDESEESEVSDESKELKESKKSEELGEFEDIQKLADRLGIFGKKVTLERELKSGDRVEIYRPLQKNPKDARRERAKKYPIKK